MIIHSKKKLIVVFIFLFSFSIFSQKTTPKVIFVKLLPYRIEGDKNLKEKIEKSLKDKMTSDFSVRFEETNLSKGLEKARTDKVKYVIASYYSRKKNGNLSLYAYFYNPENSGMIDAINVTDFVGDKFDLDLPENEIREEDNKLIDKFSKKVLLRLRSNPNRKENYENIEENAIANGMANDLSIPLPKTTNDAASEVFKFLEDVEVVTASRTKTKIKDAPASVYVVTEDQIKQRGYRTLSEALHDLPGFDIQHTYGVYPDLIHQRGLIGTMQRTLLYVDGIPDNNIFENAMLGGNVRFPLHNVERIEVISGPASALYGANAFNGIINIITKDGSKSPGNHVESIYGGWEKRMSNPGYGVNIATRGSETLGNKPIQYSVGFSYFQSKGPNFGGIQNLDQPNFGATQDNPNYNYKYDPFYNFSKKACGGTICNPDSASTGYYSSPNYNGSSEDTYNLTAKFSRGGFRFEVVSWQYLGGEGYFGNGAQWLDSKQKGLETKKFDFRNNMRRVGILSGILPEGSEKGIPGNFWDTRSQSFLLGYLKNFTDKLSLDSEFIVRNTEILNSSRDAYQNTLGPSAYYKPGDYTIADTYSRPDYAYQGEERLLWNPTSKLSSIAGVVVRHFVPAKDYGSYDRFTYNNYASYIQQVYKPFSSLSLTIGDRYDYITSFGKTNNPRIGAIYSPLQDLSFKILYGTAFREPSTEELLSLTPQRKPNKELKPETLRSMEFGGSYRFLKKYFFSVQNFYNSIGNLILEVQTKDISVIDGKSPTGGNPWNQYQNVGKAKIWGTEAESSVQFTNNFFLNINYTYTKGYYYDLPSTLQQSPSTAGRLGDNLSDDVYILLYQEVTGNQTTVRKGGIPNIAPHKGYIGFTYIFANKLSVYAGLNYVDVRRTVATNYEKAVSGYKMLKLNIRWEDFIYDKMYLQIHINNALNQQFFDPGIRVADGNFYTTMMPIERRNIWITLGYRF